MKKYNGITYKYRRSRRGNHVMSPFKTRLQKKITKKYEANSLKAWDFATT